MILKFNKVGMFLFLLLIGLTVVSAADVSIDDATPTDIQDVVEETNIQKEVNVDNTLTKETKTVKQDAPIVISNDVTIDSNNVGTYTNKNWTVEDNVVVTGTSGVTLSDVSITVGDNVQLKNLEITTTNSNTLINAIGKSNLVVEDGIFTMTNTNYDNRRTIGIDLTNAHYASVTGTTLTVNAPSQPQWQEDEPYQWVYHMDVSAILVDGADHVTIEDNTVSIDKSGAYVPSSSMPAITVRNGASYVDVIHNTISSSGAQYVYCIMMNDGVSHINIKRNTVTSTGQLYVAGIDASTANDAIVSGNTITATSTYVDIPMFNGDESLAYGIISSTGVGVNTNNKICNNTVSVTGNVTYGIEMYRGVNNMICSNRIDSNGHLAMGVAVGFTNTTNIVNNNITTTKTGSGNQSFYTDILPCNAGMQFTNQSNNNHVQGNRIMVNAPGDSNARSVNMTNDTDNNVSDNSLGRQTYVGVFDVGISTALYDSGNTFGNGVSIVLYECDCGCMGTTPSSPDSIMGNPKNAKFDEEEDILVINNENYATYGEVPFYSANMYQLNKANSVSGKTLIFSQDFNYNLIYVFANSGVKSVKEIPLNTATFCFVGNDNQANPVYMTLDGLYAPNTLVFFQSAGVPIIHNSVIGGLQVLVDNAVVTNSTIVGEVIGVYPFYGRTQHNITLTDNYMVLYNATEVKVGNNATTSIDGTFENNTPTFTVDHVLNETNYNTLFNNDNTLKDTVSGTILVIGNITKPMIINSPVNIATAPSPGKYTYNDGTIVDIEYQIANITFAEGSVGSNITEAAIGDIKINDNQITLSDSNITGKITVSASGTTIKNNNIIGENALIELLNAETTTITNNYVETSNTYTVTVDADSIENTIKDNTLIASELKGDNSVENNGESTVIENNGPLPDPELIVTTTDFTVGTPATITASIYRGENIANINKGKVTFKVNGKTLKNAEGKVIYAKVINGTATITDYEVPASWANEGTNITAVYSGSTEMIKLTSESTPITVNKSTPTLTTTDITATKASTITLTANITDGNKTINNGKVVFKVNGKTVKDENNKVIYAKVVNNTVTVTYTLPENMKEGTYNIKAIYTSTDYDKLESNATLTITE